MKQNQRYKIGYGKKTFNLISETSNYIKKGDYNNTMICYKMPKNANGVINYFNMPFIKYCERISFLYSLSPYILENGALTAIFEMLKGRLIRGRQYLPQPEKVLFIIARLAKKG